MGWDSAQKCWSLRGNDRLYRIAGFHVPRFDHRSRPCWKNRDCQTPLPSARSKARQRNSFLSTSFLSYSFLSVQYAPSVMYERYRLDLQKYRSQRRRKEKDQA